MLFITTLLIASDHNTATAVMLLDLSATFDTVDHSKFLQILENRIGIESTAPIWLSYKDLFSALLQGISITKSIEIILYFHLYLYYIFISTSGPQANSNKK